MAEAEVGDEQRREDPTVAALEELLAKVESAEPEAALAGAFRIPQLLSSTAAENPLWAITLLNDLRAKGLFGSLRWEQLVSGLARAIAAVPR